MQEKKLSSIEVDCECGETHVLENMCVQANDYSSLFLCLDKNKVKKVRILCSSTYRQNKFVNALVCKLKNEGFDVSILFISCKKAEVYYSNTINYENEDYVIAVGELCVYDIAKYYAYSVSIKVSFILGVEFYDYTFSKFARLYDGVSFYFYETMAPECVIFDESNFELMDLDFLKKYLKSKKLAYFENILLVKTGLRVPCGKINSAIIKVIKKVNKTKEIKKIINLYIFLGRAMSFFGKTKLFYSSELDLTGMIEVETKKTFKDSYLIASQCIKKLYISGLNSNLKILGLNLNKRINKIKKELNLSAIKCLDIVKKPKPLEFLLKQTNFVRALKYMLLGIIDDNFTYSNNPGISKLDLSKALYLAPEMASRYTFLNLLRDLGYLENLIE